MNIASMNDTIVEDDLISIITPAWKAASFIAETITSVQNQTYTQWEMLIVDDCSPDHTADIVETIAKQDPRIQLIRHTQNGGPAAARNTALAAARGRWIAMLDSDDLWLPQKLETQLAFQQKYHALLTYTAYRRISSDGERTGRLIAIPPSLTYSKLLGNTAIATSTTLIDRQKTGPFHFKKMYYDDFGLWLDLLRGGAIAYGLQDDLMRYRVVSQSVSRNKWHSAKQVWKTYREIERLGLLHSAFCFIRYALHALVKYRHF